MSENQGENTNATESSNTEISTVIERPNFIVGAVPETKEEVVIEADPASALETEESLDDEGQPLKSKKNYNKRIQQVIAQREEAKQEALKIKSELEALRNSQTAVKEPVKEQSTATGDGFTKAKPEMQSFGTIGEFTEALSDWKDEKREWVKTQAAQALKQQEAQAKVVQTWTTRENEVKKDLEDYDAVVNLDSLKEASLTNATHSESRSFLNDSSVGPAVLYELLQDEELTKKFASASPLQQVKILTRIELTIEGQKETPSKSKEVPLSPPKLKGGIIQKTTSNINEVAAMNDFAAYAKFRKEQKR